MKKIIKAIVIAIFTMNVFVCNIFAEPQTRKVYSIDTSSINATAYPFLQSLTIDDASKAVSINNISAGFMSSNKQTKSISNDSYTTNVTIDLDNLTYNASIQAKIQTKHTIAFKFEIENNKYYVCYFYPDYGESSYSQKIQSIRTGDIHNFNTFSYNYGNKTETYNVQLEQSTGNVYINNQYVGNIPNISVPIIFEWLGNDMTGTSFIIKNEDYQSFLQAKDWPTASQNSPIYNRSFENRVFATVESDMYEASNEYLNLPSRWIQYKTRVKLWHRTTGTSQTGTGSWEQVFDANGNPIWVETVCEYNEDNECGTNARSNFEKYWIVNGTKINKKFDKTITSSTELINASSEYKNYVYTTPWVESSAYPNDAGENVAIQYSQRTASWSDWTGWTTEAWPSSACSGGNCKTENKAEYTGYTYAGNPSSVTSWTDQCTGPTWAQNSLCGTKNKTCTNASACGYKYCNTAGCGVASYNTCATSACGVESYKTCTTSACGAKVCETSACGYKSCATSACGVSEYKTCQNSAFGYQTCDNPDCGANYKTCRNSACGVESTTYKSCANSACGVASYKTCANSACGVASTTYKSCRNSACGVASTTYKSCAVSSCGCSVYKTPKILGCKTYKTCRTAACGVQSTTYNSCRTSACGVESYTYKSCATSACGVSSYKSCRTSACGIESYTYKSCATSGCGVASYKTCATAACGAKVGTGSACGVKSYNTCANSACGTKTCQHADCGYMTCDNAACGANYKTCQAVACGVKSYVWCQHSECGAETCQSAACGTENNSCYLYSCPTTRNIYYRYQTRTWSDWSSWVNTSSKPGANTQEKEYKYKYNAGTIKYDDHPYTGQPGSSAGWYSGEKVTGHKEYKIDEVAKDNGPSANYNEVLTMQTYSNVTSYQSKYASNAVGKKLYDEIKDSNTSDGKDYVLWTEYQKTLLVSSERAKALNDVKSASIYTPYLYFWGAMFTPEENVMLPAGTAYGSPVFTYDTITITASGPILVSEEVIRRDTKVIYYDYHDPLTYYKDDLPENWEGYEYFIEEIQNSDMDSPKISVKLSADDISAMKQWLENGGYDTLGSCEMLREFSYIFVGLDDDLAAWLASGKSCKIESAKKEGE